MREFWSWVAVWAIGIILVLVVVFSLGLFGLGWNMFFLPKQENIKREVFEQTQSYVHGMTQDLANYYEQYMKGDGNDKQVIRSVIQMKFAQFDADKIDNDKLKMFLIEMRGF